MEEIRAHDAGHMRTALDAVASLADTKDPDPPAIPTAFSIGEEILHPGYGRGRIVGFGSKDGSYEVHFDCGIVKKSLSMQWVSDHCTAADRSAEKIILPATEEVKIMKDRMILGQNAIYSMNCAETGRNNNVIVCGTSGCGKTVSVAEPLLLETNDKSVVATVTKRRIVEKYTPFFRERGYQVLDLNFINPQASTVAYDPMHYIHSDADITFLAESLIKMNAGQHAHLSKDSYWDRAATSLLSAEIALTHEIHQHKASFLDVLRLHDALEILGSSSRATICTTLDETFDKAREINDAQGGRFRMALSCWDSFSQLSYKTAHSVYGVLNTVLDTVFTPELREMFRVGNKLDFSDLARRRTVLFVSSSVVNPAISGFVNLFYAQAFKELFEFAEQCPDGKLPIPVHMLCDDFATGGRIKNFPEYISIFREKQISVTILIQSESQLAGMYGASNATTILNNCDTYLYMGGMDLQTCKAISKRLNVPLSEVLYMPVGEVVVFRRGSRPLKTTRYDVMSNEQYRKVTAAYERELEGRIS